MHNVVFFFLQMDADSILHEFIYMQWMKLGLTWQKQEEEGETSLATGLFWMLQANVVVKSQCALQSRRVESPTTRTT